MLDAPVSGGAVKTAQGEMTVMMASGARRLPPEACAGCRCQQRLSHQRYAGRRAPTVKIIHQLLAGVRILRRRPKRWRAGRAGGIPLDVMYDVVTHAAGNSRMFGTYAA